MSCREPSHGDPHVFYDPDTDTLTVRTWPGVVATRVAEDPARPWVLTLHDADGGSLGFEVLQADRVLPTVVVSFDPSRRPCPVQRPRPPAGQAAAATRLASWR